VFISTNATVIQTADGTLSRSNVNIENASDLTITSTKNGELIRRIGRSSAGAQGRFTVGAIDIVKQGVSQWKWLDQASDYKSTPPNASVTGSLEWLKLYTDGNEIRNFLTPELALNAIIASAPTEPITIIMLDGTADYKIFPSTINGQPVTIDMLRDEARRLLRGAAFSRLHEFKDEHWEQGIQNSTGGFQAMAWCDEDKTKITMLDLKFILTGWDCDLEDLNRYNNNN
jgi:hypothetical protein